MKWRMTAVFAALCMLIPAFVGCGKDDDPKDPDNTVDIEKITGSYSGSLGYSVMGFEPGNIEGSYDLQIQKDASDKDDVVVILPQCSFTPPIPQAGSFTIPQLIVEGVDVTEKGNVYTISDDDFEVTVGTGENAVKYTGKLTGTIAGKDAKVEYTVRPGRMPMDINFTFQGTIK